MRGALHNKALIIKALQRLAQVSSGQLSKNRAAMVSAGDSISRLLITGLPMAKRITITQQGK